MDILIKKAEKLLERCTVCAVSSVTKDGYPRIAILAQLKTDGIKKFYFSTATSSEKVKHYKQNSKAGVTFFNGGDSVSLTGEMQIVEDRQVKESLWQDWLGRHFANGGKDDPEYCILKFTAKKATIYVDQVFETIEI